MTGRSNGGLRIKDGSASPRNAWAVTSFDPWDPRLTNRDVWGFYAQMREAGPVVWSDAHGGFWCITRYEAVRSAAVDFRTFSSADGVVIGRRKDVRVPPLEYDRPEHLRFRKAMQTPFLRGRIGRLAGEVRAEVHSLLDEVARKRHFDVVRDLAGPLPLRIISDLLGISRGDRQDRHHEVAEQLIHADRSTAAAADAAYYEFLHDEVQERRRRPGDDLLSDLARWEEDRAFDDDELTRIARGLALAGHHTTINGIASLLLRLEGAEQRSRTLQDPEYRSAVINEALRLDPPVHLEARTVTRPTSIGGVALNEGDRVALLFASGNHDEREYEDPWRFQPERSGPPHLTFGHGIHKCLGEHLALLEMSIVLNAVLERFPAYSVIGDPRGTGMVYGHHMGWTSIGAVTGPPATGTA